MIKNSDPTLHNIHGIPTTNDEFNISMARRGQQNKRIFESAEIFKIKCDVHPWMSTWCGVFEHPFYTVSKSDGTFQLPNLPTGNFTLTFWHEKLGEKKIKINLTSKKLEKLAVKFKQ